MTTPLTFTIQIASVTYDIKEGSFDFNPQIEQRTKLTFTVLDPTNSFTFQKGQVITLADSASTIQFTGTVHTSIKYKVGTSNERFHDIDCNDLHQVADERTTNRIYNGQYAGVIFASMTNDTLAGDGITANYAIREDNTQADFGQGTLSGTMATPNLGGDLELALAGSPVTIVENSSSVFNSGTLTNCQVSGGSLVPTPTPAIKLQGTESLTQDGNAYVYVQFYASGAISIISGRCLEYDVLVDPASPNGSVGIDIIMTDGSNLRDVSQDYRYRDAQNILPHPQNDIGGFAKGRWYHRKFLLDNVVGKTISHVDVVLEGNAQGTYTAYFKNVLYTNGSGTTVNTFFNGTLNVNPPKNMQNSGYSNVSCSVVNTYDCITQVSQRVSPSYQIGNAGIAKNSFISWVATQQTNTNVLIECSLDGGNSYITCKNNTALPSLLAGLSLAGLSIQFRQTFQQLNNAASPESQPMLSSMQAFINPSYIATKSDVKLSATTNTEWNNGTLTNTQVNSGVLSLLGLVRSFSSNTDLSGFTLFGDGATGPGPTTVRMHCNLGTMWVECGNSMEGHARYDTVGSWQNGRIECDVYMDRTDQRASIEYRRTNDSNYDADYAYAAEFNLNAVTLQRGSNSSASSNGTRTQVATASISIASASWHRVAMEFNGSNHKIWVDDAIYINQNDATYSASGHVSFRVSNSNVSQGYQAQFNNFGITVIGMSGTWVSPSQSLTAAGTYGGSVITWEDVSIGNQSTTVLVESTTNGGSTWQTVTNGGPVPSLTLGQSLSGVNLQLRVTLSTQTATCMPQIQYLVARVMGGYSSSGTRIAPVLSLAPALIAGSTVANWSANTPASTSVVVATSTDNVTYTGVTNGGPIVGITTQPLPILDTFATDTHTNYTSTFQAGGASGTWNFDTANSRVTIASGTSAALLWSPIWFNTGYLNKKQITINHLQVVGGSDLTNFNFPVSMIDANLATVANGGLVTNVNGFDIIFVDATETTKLDHEIEKYVSSTGEIEMWVRIPTLSHTADTIIYMYFNNSGISTTQENATGVWDSNYKAVWHMDAATGSNQPDSTTNAQTAVQNNSPVQSAGEIDGGFSFDGLADYFSVAGAAVDITGDKTIELWMNAESFSIDANGADPRILINNIDGTNVYQFVLDSASGGTIGFAVNDSTGQHLVANVTSNILTWYHLVGTYVASTHAVTLYINGVSVANNGSLSLALGTSSLFNIGRRTDALGYYFGSLDEVRVSNIVRSAGWIATTYNSQSNPDLFFAVGALTVQSSINAKDVDVIVDADAINQGGIVWRWQDASNFYQLLVYDASSNAGSANIIQLKKIVSNVTTQIGSNVAISFTRGDNHRFHVSMKGTAITISMDGVQLISTTDSSLAGPGKVGLIHVSGTGGNGDSYHNVRFQVLGQSLSGVNGYTKVTLTSTDPTVTPQLTDLTLAALHPNIGLGAYVPTVDYTRTFFSANADDLAKKSDYYWQIDPNKNAIFSPRVEQPAPWILTSNDILFPDDGSPSTLSVENSGDLYRNRMILRGVLATQFTTETHPGDGSSTSWNLKLPVVGNAPIISVNNQAKTIGQKGIDTGKDFYYALGSTSLAQDASGTLLQPNVDSFTISYTGQAVIDVQRDNTGGFPGTTTQAGYAALTGGSGIVEVVEDVTSQQMTVASAQAYGDSQLQRYGVIGRTFTCMTNRTGLSVGQYIPVFVPELGLSDASMLITAMDLKPEITLAGSQVSMLYYWTLTLVEGPNLGSWQKTLLQAFS